MRFSLILALCAPTLALAESVTVETFVRAESDHMIRAQMESFGVDFGKVTHDMIRDGRTTVQRLAEAAEINADAALLDAVTEATAFGAMKAKAADYAPVGGTGYWKSDAGFFDSASSNKWEGQLTAEEIELYCARLANLIPDARARVWLENGNG